VCSSDVRALDSPRHQPLTTRSIACLSASRAAVDLLAKQEGILLDPIYGGKAAAALIGHARDGELDDATNVLLIHTGGNAGAYY